MEIQKAQEGSQKKSVLNCEQVDLDKAQREVAQVKMMLGFQWEWIDVIPK